ncbi:MAG: substrate-binding domain-containing protein [Tepidimonas sp.]|nr:substrate-binding domain-containing protein [Tepidimonas sp.]MDM7457099.1 substrate-binding domain-containing protein [Tepidimonas sp.]
MHTSARSEFSGSVSAVREGAVNGEVVFGGSGYGLSQMKLSKQGDLYFPGSSDYMEIAKRDGDVLPEIEKIIVYAVPAINVQKGNPHNIKGIKDLLKPGLRVAIVNPEGMCVGAYAVEIFEQELTPAEREQLKANIQNYTGSCERTATAISLKLADAVIGWRVFHYWDPERIETIPLPAAQIRAAAISPSPFPSTARTPSSPSSSSTSSPGPKARRSAPSTAISPIPNRPSNGSAPSSLWAANTWCPRNG